MRSHPSELYINLHDDGPISVSPSLTRRVAAVIAALLLFVAMPLIWAATDAFAVPAQKATAASSGDDDDDARGSGGDDDDDDDQGTATKSMSATNTGNTGVSTKPQTATNEVDPTNAKNTGVSTKPQTATNEVDPTNAKNTGVSTKGGA
jgi:hypothetical protein